MNDLISRQATIDFICSMEMCDEISAEAYKKLTNYLDEVPSAQPDIVRCKECRYFAGEGMYCEQNIIVHFDHFYCYYAERRTDA